MDQPPPETASKERDRGGTETILLVEDEAGVRKSVERTLRAYGYAVVTAEDGMAALEYCRAHPGEIDLVLSDLVMPRMGGYRLYQSLREEMGPIRFLLMSGYGDRRMEKGEALDPEIPLRAQPQCAAPGLPDAPVEQTEPDPPERQPRLRRLLRRPRPPPRDRTALWAAAR